MKTHFLEILLVYYIYLLYIVLEGLYTFFGGDFDQLSNSESLLEIFATGKWVE